MNKCTRKQCPFIGVKSCDMKDCPYRTEYDWIPVTERLPEEYAQYLVCDEDGECFVYWLEDAYWARRDIEQEHIVAWMPLPEPYREDGEA